MNKFILVLFLFALITSYAQAIDINPGDTYNPTPYTPPSVTCVACPTPPACDSCCPACPPADDTPEIKIVDTSGLGDYTTVKDAVDASQAGWIILVKNGTYNRYINFTTDGTALQPIILKPYPGHNPRFDFTGSPDTTPRIEINAEYITVEGFEIKNGYDGIKVYKDHATIRNNIIESNYHQGILLVNSGFAVIEHNKIANNGTQPTIGCIVDGVPSPKHCHGIYFSNYNCLRAGTDNVIRYNHISGHGGGAIQFNGLDSVIGVCADAFTNNTITYNTFENNAVGMYLYYNFDNNTVSHNKFTFDTPPNTNESSPAFLSIWQSEGNTFDSNIFYAKDNTLYAIEVFDIESGNNTVDNNVWNVINLWWKWEGSWRSDWLGYQNITTWDANGAVLVQVGE